MNPSESTPTDDTRRQTATRSRTECKPFRPLEDRFVSVGALRPQALMNLIPNSISIPIPNPISIPIPNPSSDPILNSKEVSDPRLAAILQALLQLESTIRARIAALTAAALDFPTSVPTLIPEFRSAHSAVCAIDPILIENKARDHVRASNPASPVHIQRRFTDETAIVNFFRSTGILESEIVSIVSP